MKYVLTILCCWFSFMGYSQDMFDESFKELEKVNGWLMDAMSSFIEFPDNHENTLKVFERTKDLNKIYKELQKNKYEVLSKWDNYKTRKFYADVDKMQAYAETFEELLRTIAGYASRGIEGPTMEILIEPLLNKMGWTRKNLNVVCDDAYFVEYSYKGFKMMFIKNTRPATDYHTLPIVFTTIQVDYYYYNKMFGGECYAGGCNVGGGLYRMIQYQDDKERNYYNITRAKSTRIKQ